VPQQSDDPRREALSALPSPLARALAFVAILVAGFLGGVIGWSFMSLQTESSVWPAVAGVIGALLAAGGTAVVAVLVLRAMGEWRRINEEQGR
jgi:protein-S-isoprenylcysteine O-methyltransferase Ste14